MPSPPDDSGTHSQLVGFKRHLRVATVPGDAVYVLSEEGIRALRGSDVESLVPLLDGSRDLATVCRESSASAQPARVTATLNGLAEAGLLASRAPGTDADRTTLAYWESAGLDAAVTVANTAGGRVSLIAHQVDPGPVAEALRTAGLTVAEPLR